MAFKRHELESVADNLVTLEAEVYNPDGSTFTTSVTHRLNVPDGVETRMIDVTLITGATR